MKSFSDVEDFYIRTSLIRKQRQGSACFTNRILKIGFDKEFESEIQKEIDKLANSVLEKYFVINLHFSLDIIN